MAENVVQCDEEFLRCIKTILWGNNVKEEVFRRWAQGKSIFRYSVKVIFNLFEITVN